MGRRLLHLAILLLVLGVFLGIAISAQASPVFQATPSPQPTTTFDNTRFEKPETAQPPTQLNEGALYYWGVCMPCHGDHGQGLTEEWKLSYNDHERDCWESGCHGQDYPNSSFEIPETGIPAIAGSGKLGRFTSTRDLYDYLINDMPWGRTGTLTTETAWALSAYIKKLHGTGLTGVRINKTNGSALPVHRSLNLPEGSGPGVLVLVGILVFAAVGIRRSEKVRKTSNSDVRSRPNFVHHLHPPTILAAQARWRYTLGLGGLAIFLSLVLLLTGLLEMYYYIPTVERAAISVETITTLVPYGNLIRNLHFWAAQALVLVMTLHLLRVVLTGAYAPPRRLNYLIGLGLLVCILLLNFSGYVLRWDEGIRWALVVGTNLLKTIPWIGEATYRFFIGGSEPGAATIVRFYTWHIFGLTIVAATLTVWHAFRVRRDGGIATPPVQLRSDVKRISRFELVRREVLAILVASVLLLLLAVALKAPIDQPITPATTDLSAARAPWFFLWVQQLLKWGDPFLLGVLVPVLVVVILGLIPYILPGARDSELGSWFPRGNWIAQVTALLIFLTILVLTILGAVN
jgi:quinol-cytochrome oxidoreductase complex cytochrome b subunit